MIELLRIYIKNFIQNPMKYLKAKPKGAVIYIFLYSLLYIMACDITDPLDGIRAIINVKERGTSVTLVIYDAATEEPIGQESGEPLNVVVSGPFSDEVIDLYNRPKNEFEIDGGFLSFAVSDDLTPSAEAPVRLDIAIEGLGYIPLNTTAELINKNANLITLFMIDPQNLPEGVTGFTDEFLGVLDTDGSPLEDISFGTGTNDDESVKYVNNQKNDPPDPPIGNITAGVSFTISSDTIIRDQNGNALQGSLTSSLYYINSSYTRFSNFGIGEISNETRDYIFGRSGLVDVIIRDENGRVAHSFENGPVTTTFTYRRTFPQNASEIALWATDHVSGVNTSWSQRGVFEVSEFEDAFGRTLKQTSYQSTEFPRWQLLASSLPACRSGLQLNFTDSKLPLDGYALEQNSTTWISEFSSRIDSVDGAARVENTADFRYVPENIPVELSVFNIVDTRLTQISIPNMCAAGSRDVSINSPEFSVTLERVGRCPTKPDIEVRPSFPANIRGQNSWRWFNAGQAIDGKIELTVPEQTQYIFSAHDGERLRATALDLRAASDGDVLSDEVNLPDDVCEGL